MVLGQKTKHMDMISYKIRKECQNQSHKEMLHPQYCGIGDHKLVTNCGSEHIRIHTYIHNWWKCGATVYSHSLFVYTLCTLWIGAGEECLSVRVVEVLFTGAVVWQHKYQQQGLVCQWRLWHLTRLHHRHTVRWQRRSRCGATSHAKRQDVPKFRWKNIILSCFTAIVP